MNPKISHIINNTFLMSLATQTEQGIWVSDLIHITDGVSPAVYWISSRDTRHSKGLEKHPECAISITQTVTKNDVKRGIQMQGFAHEVQGDTYRLTCLHAEKQGLPKPASTEEYCDGDVWYVFFPYSIEMFDEAQPQKEIINVLDKSRIAELTTSLKSNGYPFTFLWFDTSEHKYKLHKHIHPVQFHILYGSVTFTYQDGVTKTVAQGEMDTETEGTVHAAKTDTIGCVYLVGQKDASDPSVDL